MARAAERGRRGTTQEKYHWIPNQHINRYTLLVQQAITQNKPGGLEDDKEQLREATSATPFSHEGFLKDREAKKFEQLV